MESRHLFKSRLTFLREITNVIGLYRCECGEEVEIKNSYVDYGNRKTCGCGIGTVRTGGRTHGLRKHPLYKRWADIKNRCLNKETPKYHYYGARGVTVCDEWVSDFKAFYEWAISNGWQKGCEIDKDIKASKAGIVGLMYSPEWCSIVSKSLNTKYRRSTKFITRNGETKCITDWCKVYGISAAAYRLRLKKGFSIEEALTTPLLRIKKQKHEN